MSKMSRITMSAAAAALAFSATGVVPAIAAEGPGAAKLDLVGPQANIFCQGLDPFPGEDATATAPGFVIFNQTGSDKVQATVSVKGWEPNTTYPVRLIQADGNDCFTIDGEITTNKQGNGTIHIREQVTGDAVQVIVNTGSLFGSPTYRATEPYQLD